MKITDLGFRFLTEPGPGRLKDLEGATVESVEQVLTGRLLCMPQGLEGCELDPFKIELPTKKDQVFALAAQQATAKVLLVSSPKLTRVRFVLTVKDTKGRETSIDPTLDLVENRILPDPKTNQCICVWVWFPIESELRKASLGVRFKNAKGEESLACFVPIVFYMKLHKIQLDKKEEDRCCLDKDLDQEDRERALEYVQFVKSTFDVNGVNEPRQSVPVWRPDVFDEVSKRGPFGPDLFPLKEFTNEFADAAPPRVLRFQLPGQGGIGFVDFPLIMMSAAGADERFESDSFFRTYLICRGPDARVFGSYSWGLNQRLLRSEGKLVCGPGITVRPPVLARPDAVLAEQHDLFRGTREFTGSPLELYKTLMSIYFTRADKLQFGQSRPFFPLKE